MKSRRQAWVFLACEDQGHRNPAPLKAEHPLHACAVRGVQTVIRRAVRRGLRG